LKISKSQQAPEKFQVPSSKNAGERESELKLGTFRTVAALLFRKVRITLGVLKAKLPGDKASLA
jgi:hypothetical protein